MIDADGRSGAAPSAGVDQLPERPGSWSRCPTSTSAGGPSWFIGHNRSASATWVVSAPASRPGGRRHRRRGSAAAPRRTGRGTAVDAPAAAPPPGRPPDAAPARTVGAAGYGRRRAAVRCHCDRVVVAAALGQLDLSGGLGAGPQGCSSTPGGRSCGAAGRSTWSGHQHPPTPSVRPSARVRDNLGCPGGACPEMGNGGHQSRVMPPLGAVCGPAMP